MVYPKPGECKIDPPTPTARPRKLQTSRSKRQMKDNAKAQAFQAADQPVISINAKKKELQS